MIQEQLLDLNHVADGDVGKIISPWLSSPRINRLRSCGPRTAAQKRRAHHKPAIGVDGLFRANHDVPPAATSPIFPRAVKAGHMGSSCQGRSNQDGVVALGVERAIGLESDIKLGQNQAVFATEAAFWHKMGRARLHHAHRTAPVIREVPGCVFSDAHAMFFLGALLPYLGKIRFPTPESGRPSAFLSFLWETITEDVWKAKAPFAAPAQREGWKSPAAPAEGSRSLVRP